MFIAAIILAVVACVSLMVVVLARMRWDRAMTTLHSEMDSELEEPTTQRVDFATELRDLPAPVRRYFEVVLTDGMSIITAAHIKHRGEFDLGDTEPRWVPFTSNQRVSTNRPSFVWDAWMKMAPGLSVFVCDAYVAGRGHLFAKLLGLVTVMRQPASSLLDLGELMRYCAESTWYPTALLPSQGVRWEPLGEDRAIARFEDGQLSTELEFVFGEDGFITSVHSAKRPKGVGDALIPSPWRGDFAEYRRGDDVMVPARGEVAWFLEDGTRRPYWRGEILDIIYTSCTQTV